MAETFTENLKLSKRDTGDLNWGSGANANLDLMDKHAQMKLLRPPRTLLASLGSGAVGANLSGNTTYFYKVTAFNAAGETTESQIPTVLEAQVTEPASPVPILLQWESVKGASGYKIYKSSSAGTEKFLAQVNGEATVQYTDDGNTAVNSGISVPTTNSARLSVTKVTAGSGIGVSPGDGTGDVQVSNAGVTGVRKLAEAAALTGDVKLEGGSGIALTQDGPGNKIIIATAGGGASSGYATEVVAAPTGTAATDTTNIQTALNSASAKGGGIVLLREGTYKISTKLTVPAKVCLAGMGKDATILQGQAALGSNSTVELGGLQAQLLMLAVDNTLVPTSSGLADVLVSYPEFIISKCRFNIKNEGVYLRDPILNFVGVGLIEGCTFIGNGGVQGIRMERFDSVKINGCHFDNLTAVMLSNSDFITITNCTGKNLVYIVNGVLRKSTMTNCVWRIPSPSGQPLSLGGDSTVADNVIEFVANASGLAAIVSPGTGAHNNVIANNRIYGIISGRGIWLFDNGHVVTGNRIFATEGVRIHGNNNAVSGNMVEGGVSLQSGASGNVVVGNKATVTDSSGQTNVVANNG